jgi:hypothetical protein
VSHSKLEIMLLRRRVEAIERELESLRPPETAAPAPALEEPFAIEYEGTTCPDPWWWRFS